MCDLKEKSLPITAVILAGGLGTRLRSVVADRPKVLAEVNGQPFLAYLLDQLEAAGIGKAVLCTGYLGGQVKKVFGDEYQGVKLLYSEERAPLGTGGAVRLALPFVDSDPILVMNGDSYCAANLAALLRRHKMTQATATLLLTDVSNVERYGAVKVARTGEITAFQEKGGITGPGLINAGVYLMSKAIAQSIIPEANVSLERDVFPGLIMNGLYGFQGSWRFIDIGIPEDYEAAKVFFRNETLFSLCREGI